MRIRTALAKSKNLVTVRVLQAIGPQYAQDYIARFGFDPKLHPAYLTMGLGAGAVTPLQMVGAYSVFANGGYRVAPYLIARVVDAKGNVLSEAKPARAGGEAERVIDPRNALIMTSLLKDVIRVGTGDPGAVARAHRPRRQDRHDQRERRRLVLRLQRRRSSRVAWIGFDQPRTLGANETGGVAALPIWIAYMQRALKGTPAAELPMPAGIVRGADQPRIRAPRRSGVAERVLLQRISAARLATTRWLPRAGTGLRRPGERRAAGAGRPRHPRPALLMSRDRRTRSRRPRHG